RRADGDSRRDRDAALDFHAVPLFTGDRVPSKDTATARKKRQGDGQGWYRAVQAHGWHSVGTLRSAALHRPQPLPRAMPTVRRGLAGAYKREHGGTLKPASRATGRRRPRRSAMFAVLELSDFLIIAVVVAFAASGISVYLRPTERARLARVEAKVDLLLKHAGLVYDPKAAPPAVL